MTSASLLSRLDARDRALFTRWVIAERTPARACQLWRVLTHLGGASVTILCCTVPLLLGGTIGHAAKEGFIILLISHLIVQLVKRSVGRPRPSRSIPASTFILEPDQFSFPSGHAAAAMAVSIAYAAAFPAIAIPIVLLAMMVGVSRVCLGVHYPGDVFMGQLIALMTWMAMRSSADVMSVVQTFARH